MLAKQADYDKKLFAPINWKAASFAREGDSIVYLDIEATALTQVRIGTLFRCYYAPNGDILKSYRLILFRVGTYFDPVRKVSNRVYFKLAQADFEEDIWGS